MIALLDELGLDRVRLAGHGWGGFAGFLICLEAPERVSHYLAAAINHPWVQPEPGVGPKVQLLGRLSYQAVLASPGLGAAVVRRPALMRELMRKGAADPESTWPGNEQDTFVDQWSEPGRAAVTVALYRTFLTKELRGLATGAYAEQTMDTPSVLLAGGRDRVIQPEGLGGFERNAPNLRLEVVEGAGHWIPEEAPEELLRHMRQLFEGPEV